nr:hypothetical protein [uncultured Azospirillum sp.]
MDDGISDWDDDLSGWKVIHDDLALEPNEEVIAKMRLLYPDPDLWERGWRLYLAKLREHDAEIRPLPPTEREAFRVRLSYEARREAGQHAWSRAARRAASALRTRVTTAVMRAWKHT